MNEPYAGPCLCDGRGWFSGSDGDTYCSCEAGTEKRRLDDQIKTDLYKRQSAAFKLQEDRSLQEARDKGMRLETQTKMKELHDKWQREWERDALVQKPEMSYMFDWRWL